MSNVVNFPIANQNLPEFYETAAERIKGSNKFVYIAEYDDGEDGVKYAFGHNEMNRTDLIVLYHHINAYLNAVIHGDYDE